MFILNELTKRFSIGDKVSLKWDKTNRVGTISKIHGKYITVDFSPTEKLIGRRDVYYDTDLILVDK